jgi:hypothetical protein
MLVPAMLIWAILIESAFLIALEGAGRERHVGEALNQLMLVGYRVFHDFLITDKPRSIRNIDHIVIGSNGVFAVETKTRRKMKGENGATVRVLDNALQYPWGIDQRDLAQAEEDAHVAARLAFENVGPKSECRIDTCASGMVH